MSRYEDLAAKLAEQIVDGDLAPGAFLPSVRDLAFSEEATARTVARSYRELAYLRKGAMFRLAGSDDPALSLLVAMVSEAVGPVGAAGSYRGLGALAAGRADGAALHLRHRSGEYNAPFARGVLAGRDPILVPLLNGEQGL